MIPVMWVIGGFRRDAMQETHHWHIADISAQPWFDPKEAVAVHGTETNVVKKRYGFIFHMPIIGGWKEYVALQPKKPVASYRIGWTGHSDRPERVSIHKLPIRGDQVVRMLSGPAGSQQYFFALDEKGDQIPLTNIGKGALGDKRYPGSRLF